MQSVISEQFWSVIGCLGIILFSDSLFSTILMSDWLLGTIPISDRNNSDQWLVIGFAHWSRVG